MLKEALQYIVSLGEIKARDINGHTYTKDNLKAVLPPSKESDLTIHSLDSLVDYIKSGLDCSSDTQNIVNIESPGFVRYIGMADPVFGWNRNYFVGAAADSPMIELNCYMNMEKFIIQLKTCFDREQGDWESLLRLASCVSVESGVKTSDDGISQTVTAKTGIAHLEDVVIPNTIKLAPMRSFHEIKQPLLEFVFRIDQSGRMGLFEADGGAWKGEARSRIKEYLSEQLKECEGIHILG